MQVGEFVQERFGLGGGGQDAADGRQGEGAEADGAFQGGTHVVTLIMGDQRQQLLGLEFALDLLGEQAVEELQGDRAEFAEALSQEPCALDRDRPPDDGLLMQLPHAGLGAGHERMPGDFLQADRVDDDFAFGDAHGQHLADVRPGHGVKIASMGDVAFDVDVAIDDQGGVEVAAWQRQQVRLFALVTLQRRFLEVAQHALVGDVCQPPGGHLVEMLQRLEGAAIEQAGFDIEELAFDFAFGLRPAHAAGLGAEAVVRGEGEELGIVEGAVGIVTQARPL